MESSASKRRFPPPWSVEKADSSFIVRDANSIALAAVAYWDGLGRWTFTSKHLTENEDDAMACARKLKEPHVIFFLSMALIALADMSLDDPHEPPSGRGLH
jgi:hypothetical protein